MEPITVETIVQAPIEKVWETYTNPEHIVNWNFATPDWCCPKAENDVRVGGKFSSRMEAKDGTVGFDFGGTYDEVVPMQKLAYTFGERKASVEFFNQIESTKVVVLFDPENENPIEMQRSGWQTILNNFKEYTEDLL